MMHAAFPVATAATDLTGTSSRATSLQATEYTLMDSAHFGFFFSCILTTRGHIYGVCPRGRQDAATQSARKQAHTHTITKY